MSSLSVPPPPRSPSPRAKKLIHAYAGSQLVLLIVGSIFMLVGAPLSLVFCRSLPGELMLTLGHETTSGRVTGAELQTNVRINNKHPTRISFDYDVGGQTFHAESSVVNPGPVGAGDTVNVEYLESSPDVSRLEGGTYGTFPLFVSFVLLFPLLGLFIVGGAVRSNLREIRAFREGNAMDGVVSFVGLDLSTRVNGRNPLKVEWTFEVQGAPYKGNLSSLDHSALAGYAVGQRVTVLYLPGDPKANTLWLD